MKIAYAVRYKEGVAAASDAQGQPFWIAIYNARETAELVANKNNSKQCEIVPMIEAGLLRVIDASLLEQLREFARRGDGTICVAFDTVHCDGEAIVLPTVHSQPGFDHLTGPVFVHRIQELLRDRKDLVEALRQSRCNALTPEGFDAIESRFKDV